MSKMFEQILHQEDTQMTNKDLKRYSILSVIRGMLNKYKLSIQKTKV